MWNVDNGRLHLQGIVIAHPPRHRHSLLNTAALRQCHTQSLSQVKLCQEVGKTMSHLSQD
ncbi:hypothetical protein JYU34_019626 [Plutella xylostella]|uniref:Uncharacterized protein n=1 Tax=Plutella xylostella TaxID=51655 RepID=A0ABQ7PX67_PLUXY|nr:hypothetical protein JYU34_019626 [Plutella xylostella]